MALKKSELYSSLWSSCDELRGGMDASQYKDYVLVLLFVKYISDRYSGQPYAPIRIRVGASFADMVVLKGNPEIGDLINKNILRPLAEDNALSDMPDFNDSTGLDAENDPWQRIQNYGVPSGKQGDYAYLLHILRSLKPNGKGACILPHGVLFRGNVEAAIRRKLIQYGYINGIIGLPPNLFYGTGIPACIVVLDKEGANARKGIFMIDASKGFIKDGNKNRLREQDVQSHYVWGNRYLLRVVERDAPPSVEIKHSALVLNVRPGATEAKKKEVLEHWYREQIRDIAPRLIAKWERIIGVKVQHFYVQRMKTKWGSCSESAGTIRLNSELAKKPRECLEYIVVHEMVHLLERTHNRRFMSLMEQFMPRWQSHRELLNRLPVRREKWVY